MAGDVAVLTLRHAPVNSLDSGIRASLESHLQNIARSQSAVAAVVVTGQGPFFCAGADISEFGSGAAADASKWRF